MKISKYWRRNINPESIRKLKELEIPREERHEFLKSGYSICGQIIGKDDDLESSLGRFHRRGSRVYWTNPINSGVAPIFHSEEALERIYIGMLFR